MKRLLTVLLVFPAMLFAQTQSLTLQKTYELAEQNYPLIRQRELIKQTSEYSEENLGKGFLPQINLSGQATYQSAVTQVKLPAPGLFIEPLSKDQYRILGDVS
ncbi:MAG: transporter, partial [Bacteroidetes bacterium]